MPDLLFLDVLPRFDWAAQEAGVKKITGMYDNAAKKIAEAFGGEVRNAAKASTDKIAADVADMQRAVNASTTKATEDFRALTKANADLEIQTRRLTEMTAKYGDTSSQATRALYGQAEAQTRLAATTDAYAASMAREAEAADAAAAAQARHAAAVEGGVAKTAVLGTAMNTAGALAAGATVVVAAATGKMAADFQSSQERLVTSAGETQNALGTVSKGLLDMAGQVGYSSEQLSKGMYTVESAGFHGAEGLKVMQAAAQGAKTENADLSEVTNAVTTALHDFHLSADQSAEVTSKMVTAVSQGKTTFESLTSSLHSVQPIAASLVDTTKDLATQQAQGKHIMDDMLGSLAQMTASGMSADQATQNMADAIRHLQNPTAQMRAELGQLGIDSRDLQDHLGERGLAGSMEVISKTILERMGPSGKVMLDAMNQSKVAADAAGTMLGKLPESARSIADQVNAGTMTLGQFRKAIKDLPEDQANILNQWRSMHDRAGGFNQVLKAGGSDVQAYTAALAKATGDASSLNVALQLTGQNTAKTNETIAMIAGTTQNADGSVKGWELTQQTFNTRLDQAKASFGALGIQVGNIFLPILTQLATGLGTAAHWLGEHQGLVKALVITLAAAGTAWAVYRTATALATAAMTAFDAAADANPIGLIVLALAALVAGIVYAYNHWSWFKTGVQAVWDWLKGFGEWIGRTLGPVFKEVGHVIAEVWTWLYNNVIKPYGEYLKAEFKAIEVVVKWLWENVFRPYIHFIGDVVMWLWHNIMEPAGAALGFIFQTVGALIKFAWDTLIKPVFDAWGDVFMWLWHTVIEPAVEGFKLAWAGAGIAWQELHDHVIKPVSDKIGTVFNAIKEFAKDMVTGIKAEWDKIKGIVSEPVRFIVETVYDKGIANVYNHIADVFGGPHLPELKFEGFAAGGVLPGYSPGRDNMLGRLPSGRVVGLSGGEGILVPELARMLGADTINKANAAASGRRRSSSGHYDGGGILDTIGNAVGGAVDIATDPVGALRSAVDGLMGALPGDPNSGWIQVIKGIPGHLVDLLAQGIGNLFGGGAGGPGNMAPPAAPAQVLEWIRAAERLVGVGEEWTSPMSTLVMRESGGRPDAVNLSDDNAKRGDPSRGLAQTIGATFRAYHRPEDGPADPNNPIANLAAAMRYIQAQYGSIFSVQQANPNMPPKGYDAGTPSVDDPDSFSGYNNLGPDAAAGAAAGASAGPLAGLTPLGARGSEQGGQIDTIAAARAAAMAFPSIRSIGLYRSPDGFNEHSSGEAADVMIPGAPNTPAGVALGNQVASWALQNAGRYGIKYVLWRQRQWNPDGSSSPMSDRGSPTANHMDHVHIRTAGGGYPQGGGPGSAGAGSMPSGTMSSPAAGGLPAGLTAGAAGSRSGRLTTAAGNETKAESTGGGMMGSSILTGMGSTQNWSIKGFAQYIGAMLANFALGNPLGRQAAGAAGAAGGGPATAGAAVDATDPAAAANVQATTDATAAYNGENAKTLKYKAEIAAADERIAKAEAKLQEQQAKHPGGGTTVMQAQHNLDVARQAKGDLEQRIREAGGNAATQASIDAQRAAEQQAKTGKVTPGTQRALQGQQETLGAAGSVGLGPAGVPGVPPPGTTAGVTAGVSAAPGPPQPASPVLPGGGGAGSLPGAGMGMPQGLPIPAGTPQISPSSFAGPAAAAGAADSARPSSVLPSTRVGGTGPGFSTSIGETAAGMLGPMGGAAAPAGKLADRTIGYMGQLAGIAASGLIETFLPSGVGDKLADPGKSWFGKLALGIAGGHHEGDNSAGASGPPIPPPTPPADKASLAAGSPAAPAGAGPDQGTGLGAPGGGGQGGQGQGNQPLIGEMNITQQQPVDGGAVGRDINRYAGGLTR